MERVKVEVVNVYLRVNAYLRGWLFEDLRK